MRSKEERRALHVTPQKPIRDNTQSSSLRDNSTRIFSKGGGMLKETKINGQSFFEKIQSRIEDAINENT